MNRGEMGVGPIERPRFTVFTPTFNRASTLSDVYGSLRQQSFRDFEWLIVDDGSTDSTGELVQSWIADHEMPIRYFRKANGGKHTAFNLGVREARGEFFLPLDSDDTCEPLALERLNLAWQEIAEERRAEFSGVTCLCRRADGALVGDRFPDGINEGHPFDIASRFRIMGEKWGFHRTEILRRYPFPVFLGERFVPESLVWNRIGRPYKIRFINDPLRIYEHSKDSLSKSIVAIRAKSPQGSMLYYREYMSLPIRLADRCLGAANLWRFAIHGRRIRQVLDKNEASVLLWAGLPIGAAAALIDRILGRLT